MPQANMTVSFLIIAKNTYKITFGIKLNLTNGTGNLTLVVTIMSLCAKTFKTFCLAMVQSFFSAHVVNIFCVYIAKINELPYYYDSLTIRDTTTTRLARHL